jgi:hypothetical protein
LLPPRLPLVAPHLRSPLRRGRLFLIGCCVENHALRGRQKPRCIFHYLFLRLPSAAPNDSETLPPHIPPRSRALPNILPTANANFWLVVVFSQPERQPPKPRPRSPLCFLIGCISAPKTREPTAVLPNPKARALHGHIGSRGAMRWWRCWPTHGERGLKLLEGRAAVAHVGCCVCCWLCL